MESFLFLDSFIQKLHFGLGKNMLTYSFAFSFPLQSLRVPWGLGLFFKGEKKKNWKPDSERSRKERRKSGEKGGKQRVEEKITQDLHTGQGRNACKTESVL